MEIDVFGYNLLPDIGPEWKQREARTVKNASGCVVFEAVVDGTEGAEVIDGEIDE
jgi:hypothetical protein